MTIYFGDKPISKLFLGIKEIIKAYKGTDVIYSGTTPTSDEVQLINGGKGLKISTDFQLPDGSYPRNEIVIPNLCADCSYSDYESWTTDSWQFSTNVYGRYDGTPGTIEYVSLEDTPITFPITVGNETWTTTSNNSNDLEGLNRTSTHRSGNSIATGDLTPTPYLPMSSLLNKQDFVGALKITNLSPNTWYGLEVAVDSLYADNSTTNNWVQTDVPFTIAVFDGDGNKIDINCTCGENFTQGGSALASNVYGAMPLLTGTRDRGNMAMLTHIKTTFNSGSNSTFYVAVMYKGSKFTGESTDQCIWHLGGVNLGINNSAGSYIGVPLYLNVEVDTMMGRNLYFSLARSNYGNARYMVTINSSGVGTLTEI